jgi:FtsP/CotA-like multicopper oxidase with cupredoxin domain
MNALNRRKFLRFAGLTGLGLGIAACARPPSSSSTASTAMTGMDTPTAAPGGPSADEMDAMHKKGIDTFVANAGKDPIFWRKPLDYKMDGDTKVFKLACAEGTWDISPDQSVDALMYNGMVPGPEIRVTEGDKVRVVCNNKMTRQSTSIHWHGVLVPNKMDGVPYITQDPIKPGTSFTYEFVAQNPGSHMYHSHHNAAEQVTRGLLGAFIIEPKDKSKEPQVDAEYTLILNDTGIGLSINGKSFPYTQPLTAKLGQMIRVRYMNEGLLIHPMHLHGLPQQVIAQDGWPVPNPWKCDTLDIAPGQRWDVLVKCDAPGIWAYHCHILTHSESSHGMFGMVTALIIQ